MSAANRRWILVLAGMLFACAASCGTSGSSTGSGGATTGGSAGASSGGAGGGGTGGTGGGPCDPTKCPAPSNECKIAVCDASGQCAEGTKPDGTPAAQQTAGDCKKKVCSAGALTDEDDDTDLPDDGNDCTDDVCASGVPQNPVKPIDTPCGPGGASFCDGNGKCAVCTKPSQCPGQDTECQVRTCDAGQCGTKNTAKGTPVASQTMGDCQQNVCDGNGAVTMVPDAADPEDDGNACTTDECAGVITTHPPVPTGTPCGAGLQCDGMGDCVTCTVAADCGVPANPCLDATCVGGACGTVPKADGTACDDGSACTQSDTCVAGACTGSSPVVCTAQDQCHDAGTCNPADGTCDNPPKADGAACDDGNGCTQSDTCQSGTCAAGSPITCMALDQCHVAGTCNPATGMCSNPTKPNGTACNDGDLCTQMDACLAGVCTGNNPVQCVAQDQCHDAGTCNPATGTCSKPPKADGAPCNDGQLCTTGDACVAGVCAGSPVQCTPLNQCHVAGTCNPATGTCSNPLKSNGTVCDDGNGCTQTDTCQNGNCVGSNPIVCQPLDQCHNAGTCLAATGMCTNPNKPNGTVCNDGNGCTQTDTCQTGICKGTSPVVCMALDQCHTAGTCDPMTGMCTNPTKPDGSMCTLAGQAALCSGGVCAICGNGVIEGAEQCDDGNTTLCDGCSQCKLDAGVTYSAGPGLALSVTDDGYTGALAAPSMSCVSIAVPAAGDGFVDFVCATAGITHPTVGDLTIKLVSPGGAVVTLMSRPGVVEAADNGAGPTGDTTNLSATSPITFRDGGPKSAELMGNTLTDTQIVCQDDAACTYDPNNGAAAAGKLVNFIGQSGTGTWKLCVGDSDAGAAGSIDQVKLIIGQ
jgi:cysteine-rich repeat protein